MTMDPRISKCEWIDSRADGYHYYIPQQAHNGMALDERLCPRFRWLEGAMRWLEETDAAEGHL